MRTWASTHSSSNSKQGKTVRPVASRRLFISGFLRLLGIDSNHGIATLSWLVGFAVLFFAPYLKAECEGGVIASPSVYR